jgi:hypothetical protein
VAFNQADEALKQAIRETHGGEPVFVESVPVREEFETEHETEAVWEGVVHVFDLQNHPTATRCYAWSEIYEVMPREDRWAFLHQGPVDSPGAAVRASIVEREREGFENRRQTLGE